MKFFSRDIRFSTFLKIGLPPVDDRFGVYFVTGRQGSGKSYYAVYLLHKTIQGNTDKLNKVYTNMQSLKVPDCEIVYFTTVDELYQNIDEDCIFILDELSRKYDKNSRTDTQFYAWLNQSRKRRRIVIMITQEWRELPMWIRRPAKFMITTRPATIMNKFGIYRSCVGDAENMTFNKDEGEYECPPITYIYYKRCQEIAKMYDTFEAINQL